MGLYRVLISVFALVTVLGALRRGGVALVRARLGLTPAQPGPHLWWHGASNGELASARAALTQIMATRPDLAVLVTCNSNTGVALVQSWGMADVTALPAPLDLAWVSRRVMRRWSVVAHVSLESEIWPHRILACPGPVILLGARMSAGTARSWARLPGLAARVLGRVRFVSAQDADSLDRLRALGLAALAAGPVVDLKAVYTPQPLPDDPTLQDAFLPARTWLAASTHPGEDAVVLRAHLIARQNDPALRLILAPRHPDRADGIAAQISALGLTCARRSHGDAPDADVYLADTMGEMPRWYALAGRVFIGGTLTDRGGHTPYEPAHFGAALIHGPDTRNFQNPFARLSHAQAATQVTDDTTLAQALLDLSAPAAQAQQGQAAQAALRSETDLDGLVSSIATLLPATNAPHQA